MSISLVMLVVITSLITSSYFVVRDAKKFALNPPTPLIDLDRMYDVIFERLDEVTGSLITPKELSEILNGFVVALGRKGLISENLAESEKVEANSTLDYETILESIKQNSSEIDVQDESILKVIDLSFTYLREINALT